MLYLFIYFAHFKKNGLCSNWNITGLLAHVHISIFSSATRKVSRTKRPSKETNIDDILDPYIPPPSSSNNKSDKYNGVL